MFLSFKFSGRFIQNSAAIAISLTLIVSGITLGWSSPLIPLLISKETPLADGPITVEQASMITATFYISACVGILMFGKLADILGRKWTIITTVIPQICAFVLILLAKNWIYLLISRTLSGIASNGCFIVVPMFLSEIAEKKNRGAIGSYTGTQTTLGIALGYIVGTYFHIYVGASFCLLILVIFLLISFPIPETPQYLLMKKREVDAMKSLTFYRGFRESETLSQEFLTEFEELKSSINNVMQKSSLSLKDFKLRSTRKAILICFIMYFVRCFTGLFQMENFAVIVLDQAGAGIGGNASAIASSVFVHLLSYVSMYLIEKVGRRWLMLVSSLGASIFMAILSIMVMLNNAGVDISTVNWIPTIVYAGYNAIAVYGILVVPVIISTETLPIKIKSLVLRIFLVMSNLLTTAGVNYFMIIAEYLGLHVNLWIFASACFIEFLFLYFLLPETKGKTHEEIVKLLE